MSGATFSPITVHTSYGTLHILWIKALHIVFIVLWSVGPLYLPCIFISLAVETGRAAITCLLIAARKLFRFTTILAVIVILLGLWLFLSYRIGLYPPDGWVHAELALVLVTIGYYHGRGVLLRKFGVGANKRSHKSYRRFNELPMLLLLAITILAVVKPL